MRKQEKAYIEFEKNKWIKKNDTRKINHYERDFKKILKLFINTKYLWGGKTSNGIDCSALIQIYFYYNRIFFPRDTKDQIKFCKKLSDKKLIKKNILFWRGHVAICLNNKKLIHAYGPKKKVLIMDINRTIDKIYKTTKLKPIYVMIFFSKFLFLNVPPFINLLGIISENPLKIFMYISFIKLTFNKSSAI